MLRGKRRIYPLRWHNRLTCCESVVNNNLSIYPVCVRKNPSHRRSRPGSRRVHGIIRGVCFVNLKLARSSPIILAVIAASSSPLLFVGTFISRRTQMLSHQSHTLLVSSGKEQTIVEIEVEHTSVTCTSKAREISCSSLTQMTKKWVGQSLPVIDLRRGNSDAGMCLRSVS